MNNASFTSPGVKSKGVDIIDGGASLTFLGFSPFGHFNYGEENGTMTPVAESATRGAPKSVAWVAGGQWSGGPWTIGGSYYYLKREGSAGGTGNDSFRAEAVGGDYNWAPGFDIRAGAPPETVGIPAVGISGANIADRPDLH